MAQLKAPFPWFGGKSRVAGAVWDRFGPVKNYVEPFFGSGAAATTRQRSAFGFRRIACRKLGKLGCLHDEYRYAPRS